MNFCLCKYLNVDIFPAAVALREEGKTSQVWSGFIRNNRPCWILIQCKVLYPNAFVTVKGEMDANGYPFQEGKRLLSIRCSFARF